MIKAKASALWLALAAGVSATALGLSRLDWPGSLPSQDQALWRLVTLIAGLAVALRLFSGWFKRPVWLGACALAVAAAAASASLSALSACALFFVAAACTGAALLRRLGLAAGDEAAGTRALLAGSGLLGTAASLLASRPVHFSWVYVLVLAVPVVLSWSGVRDACVPMMHDRRLGRAFGATDWLDVGIATVALVYVVVAFMPEIGHDAMAMHLFVIHQLATQHAWSFDVGSYVWAVMPMLGDWIFAIPYMLGGEAAARLANVGFILVTASLVRELARWAGATESGWRWAVLIFLSTPLTFIEGSSLFIESVWGSFLLAGSLALLVACTAGSGRARHLVAAGLFLGLALAAKAITMTVLPVLLVVLVWRFRYWLQRGSARQVLTGLGLFVCAGAIPYAVAFRKTGNPVFPFFNQVFKSPLFPAGENFESASIFGKGVTWDLPYQATFSAGRLMEAGAGAGGFQWLLLVIPVGIALLLGWQRRPVALMFVALASIAMAFMSVSYLRYVFPSVAILCAVAGVGLSTAPAWS